MSRMGTLDSRERTTDLNNTYQAAVRTKLNVTRYRVIDLGRRPL